MARFTKNIGWVSFAQISASLAAFIYTLITARTLGVENYGLFQAAMGIYGLFSIVHLFLYFGAVHCTGRASPDQRKAVLGALLTLALLFSAAVFSFFLISLKAGTYTLKAPNAGIWLVCGSLIAANSLLTLFYGAFQAEHRFRLYAASKIIEVTLTLLLGLIFLNLGTGPAGAIGGYAAAMILLSAYFWMTLRPPLQLSRLRSLLTEEMASLQQLTLALFFLLILEHSPAIWARVTLSASESGHFAAAYNLRNTVWPFALSVTLTFYAHLLARDQTTALFRQALGFILALAAGFELAVLIGARPLVKLLYGAEFLDSASLLPLYGISLALQMIAMLFLFNLVGRGKLRILPLFVSLGVFSAVLLLFGQTASGIIAAQTAAASCAICFLLQSNTRS